MREHIGHFELVALLATMRLGDNAYGVSIASEIESLSGKGVALASLYVTLDRLQQNGLVQSRLGEPTAERGGRAKRYFWITPKGLVEVKAARRTLVRMWAGIPELGGETA